MDITMYIIRYMFIAPISRRNDAKKCNLRIKPNNPDPVQKSIELRVCLQLKIYNSVGG